MENMKDFANYVKEHILEYLPDSYSGGEVIVSENTKEGGKKLTGITVRLKGAYAAPLVYLDGYFKNFKNGMYASKEVLMCAISDAYLDALGMIPDINPEDFSTKENVKDRLRLRLVNAEKNADWLQEQVHLSLGEGLALVVCIDLGKKNGARREVRFTKDTVEHLNYPEADVIFDAWNNTTKNHPAMLVDMENIMLELIGARMIEPGDNLLSHSPKPDAVPPMMVLTNRSRYEGAVTICYPGMPEQISRVVGGSFYVLPSSIHELIIIPDNKAVSPQALANMVRMVNTTQVKPEEQLGDEPLYYDAAKNRLSVVVAA